jgi:hypothetical protein
LVTVWWNRIQEYINQFFNIQPIRLKNYL